MHTHAPTLRAFHPHIDLFDETLREGSERSPIAVSIETKIALARATTRFGIKTIVVGMFPDVPHNIDLLRALVDDQRAGAIPDDVRFIVISHLGPLMCKTLSHLRDIDRSNVWVLAIHSVSDEQIQYLYPTVRRHESDGFNTAAWERHTSGTRRELNLDWLAEQLVQLSVEAKSIGLGGVIVGLLDSFRADSDHLHSAVDVAHRTGIRQIRLVDTAGTATPEQSGGLARSLVDRHPDMLFYGHFHDDFGMATANAISGLRCGLAGVDVAVGGFANRAGHPDLAEVAMALRNLYGISLARARYQDLYALSRIVEESYGLLESPSKAVTGVITHTVQSGIRTELVNMCPRIFDALDPADAGGTELRMFGVRSGADGIRRIIADHAPELPPHAAELDDAAIDDLYTQLVAEWDSRSQRLQRDVLASAHAYRNAIGKALFSEATVTAWLVDHLPAPHTTFTKESS